MLRDEIRGVLLWSAACLLCVSSAAGAQSVAKCTPGANGFMFYGVNSKSGEPFSGTTKTTFEQTLPAGNRIHSETTSFQARDSAGRVRTEQVEECLIGEDGKPHPRIRVQVQDPVTKANWMWEVGESAQKVVTLFHFNTTPRKQTPEELAEMQRQMKLSQERWKLQSQNQTEEKLGTRDLNNQLAEGTRTMEKIPAGTEGNELPLVTVNEMWRSRTLDLVLLAISEDPRRGKTTFEYQDLTLGEPDAGLFKPPEGYKIIEQHPEPE